MPSHDEKPEALRTQIELLRVRRAQTTHDSEKTRLDLVLRSLEHDLDMATREPALPAPAPVPVPPKPPTRPVEVLAFRVHPYESSRQAVLRSIAADRAAAALPRY